MRKQERARVVNVIIHNHVQDGSESSRWKRLKRVLLSGAAGFLAGSGLVQLLT